MSLGKGGSKSSSQQNVNTSQQQQQQQNEYQEQYQGESQTPNNLAALQKGWESALNFLNGGVANPAVNLITSNANNASAAANAGMNTAANLANGGTANATNPYLLPTARGDFLNQNNPYFKNMVDQITRSAQQATDGDFAASGRYGSGANANAFNSAVVNATGQLGAQNYTNERANQLSALNQLSNNNSTSVNQALAALGLLPNLGTAATGAGQAAFEGTAAPINTFANILALLGPGGGTAEAVANGSGNASGSASGSGNSNGTASGSTSSSNFGINLGNLIQPFKLFG